MMCRARRGAVVPVVLICSLALVSCGGRQRVITRGARVGNVTPLAADKDQLVDSIAKVYDSIQSFSASVHLKPSAGSVYKGKITDYREFDAFIDFRKPTFLRVVMLLPVLGTTAFHMVSDGAHFRASIPPYSRFIEGANDAPPVSKKPYENIRPQTFLSAMLVKPVDSSDLTIKVDDITEQYAYYQLSILKKLPGGEAEPYRRITFDRVNLLIIEQREYDPDGTIISMTKYGDWQTYSGIRFPSHIDISRPKSEYGVELVITKLDMNLPIPDSKFVLQRPEGSELQIIGSQPLEPAKVAK